MVAKLAPLDGVQLDDTGDSIACRDRQYQHRDDAAFARQSASQRQARVGLRVGRDERDFALQQVFRRRGSGQRGSRGPTCSDTLSGAGPRQVEPAANGTRPQQTSVSDLRSTAELSPGQVEKVRQHLTTDLQDFLASNVDAAVVMA